MTASEIALPLRIGARTLGTLRRRLARHALSLDEALADQAPSLPPLEPRDHGYLVTALPADRLAEVAARHADLRPFIRQRYRRGYARLDQDFEGYLGGFSAKSRATCRRKLRRMAERSGGAIDVREYADETQMRHFHELARTVSQKTYQERLLDSGLPDGSEAIAAMLGLARAGRARGWLLFLEEKPVAYLYAPAHGLTLIYAHLGYDPDVADFSPGTVLQLEVMQRLMAEGRFRLFDFTEGDGQHKRLFASGGVDCLDLLLVRRSAANLLAGYTLTAFDGAVALAKRVAGEGLARRLRR